MKFKVGDIVRVIASQAELKDIHCDLVSQEVYLIEETDPDDDHLTYKLDADVLGVWVKEDMIKLAEELPLKRDDKITLELTGEEVFWIKALTGSCNGTFATNSLYDKVEDYFEHPLARVVGGVIDLYGRSFIVNKILSETFEPEIEELTLEQVCKELGRDVKIIK